LASKPLGQFVGDLTSVSPDLALKPVVTVFLSLVLKLVVTDFSIWTSKPTAKVW
jgi:hypothetical protein